MSDINDQELERLLKAARDLLNKSRSYGPTTDEERQARSLINKAKKFAMATRNSHLKIEWTDLNYQLKGVTVRKPKPNLNRGFQGVQDPRSYGSGGLADSHEPEGDDIQEDEEMREQSGRMASIAAAAKKIGVADPNLLYRMDKAEDRACTYFSQEACGLAVRIGDLLRAGKKREGLKMLQDPKNEGLLPIIPREVRSWFGMTVSNSYEPSGETVSEDEWGGGFQSPADGNREVQAGLKGDFQRERAQKLKLIVQVIRGEITKQKFKKLTGSNFDELMQRSPYFRNQIKRMSKKALAPVNPPAPAAPTTESADMDIQEKVDIDGRTRAYRETVMRLESARKLREQRAKAMQENRFGGLYDDGSGKGAIIPAPVDYNFHEAMRVVEKYRSLREKKKTLMGAPKEDMDAAVVMKGDKFSMSETELSPKQKEFRTFFKKALTKFGKSSPAKMDDAEKKKFFNWIEKNWKG